MGTTTDKLQAIWDSTEAIRVKLGIAEDTPLSSYAGYINNGSGGGTSALDFFRCVAVGEKVEEPDTPTEPDFPQLTALPEEYLLVSGCSVSDANGVYKLKDRNAVGYERRWVKISGGATFCGDVENGCYALMYDGGATMMLIRSGDSPIGSYTDSLPNGTENGVVVTQYEEEYVYQFKVEGEAGNPSCLGEYTLEDTSTMAGWRKWVNSNGKAYVNWLSPDTWYIYTTDEGWDMPCYVARVASPSTPPTDSSLTWTTAAGTTPIPTISPVGTSDDSSSGDSSSSSNSTDIIVDGLTLTEANGTYTLKTPDALDNEKYWEHSSGAFYIDWVTYDNWAICRTEDNELISGSQQNSASNPVDVSGWNESWYGGIPTVKWASGSSAGDSSSSELPEPVFYAPLTEQKNTAETGQALTYNGNVQFTEVDGRKCAYFDGSSYIQFSDAEFPAGGNERTIACWVKQTSADTGYQHVFGYGGDESYKKFYICTNPYGYISFTQYGSDFGTGVSPDVWKFVVITHKDGQQKIYVDGGVESASGGLSVNTTLAIGRIGASQNLASDEFFKGYVADAILYDVAFSPEQIEQLYQKMLPTSDPLPANTWNGQKAIRMTDAETGKPYYDFEETVTEGLTFGNGFTPVRGRIYDREAMVEARLFESVKIPQDGLVFYASLSKQASTSETGQSVIESSGTSYTEKDGIPCIYFDGSSASIKYEFTETLNFGSTASQSIWFYDTTGDYPACITDYGNASDYHHYNHYNRYNEFSVGLQGDEIMDGSIQQNKWYHFVSVVNNNNISVYINGEKLGTYSLDFDIKVKYAKIGDGIKSFDGLTGYCAAARLYNRALTEEEIQQLYQEFAK